MKEYQQAWRIPALQCFISNLGRVETCADMMTDSKRFYSMFQKEKRLQLMLELRYFTMRCNNAEYKKVGQDTSLGQLYDVQN